MRRHRLLRGRSAALALLPAAALITTTTALTATTVLGASAAADRQPATLQASKKRVATGGRVRLAGRFPAAPATAAGADAGSADSGEPTTTAAPTPERVRIQFRPRGRKGWRDRAAARVGAQGRWSRRVRVPRSGRFRAVGSDGRVSEPRIVRVRARIRPSVGRRHLNVGQRTRIGGRVTPAGSRRRVVVRVGGKRLRTRTRRDGRFDVRWRAPSTGTYAVRINARGNGSADGNRRRSGRLTAYRPAVASWYGPGFYGNRTACGQTLTTSTIGVAHKTMPCGTRLTLRHKGRSVRVRVIDRGPYTAGREFDLTSATKQRLGFGSVGTVYSSR